MVYIYQCSLNPADLQSDFVVSTSMVDLSSDDKSVGVTLRRDSLSLEGDEMFQLKLIPASNFVRMNEFVADTLNVTIIDNDGKS